MNKWWLVAALMAAAFLLSASARADDKKTIVVYDFYAYPGDLRSDGAQMASILRYELERTGEARVREFHNTTCHDASCAQSNRKRLGADAVVVGEITTLGGVMNLYIRAVWSDNTDIHRVRIASVAEFNKLAERLADAIVSRNDYDTRMAMDSVSQAEKRPYKDKQMGNLLIGGMLGAWMPVADSYLSADYLYQFTVFARYQVADFGFEVEWGYDYTNALAGDLYSTEYPLDLNALYFFSKRDRSFYLGGGFGLHGIAITEQPEFFNGVSDIDYWAPHLAGFAGFEIGRAQRFVFTIRAGYQADLISFDEAGPLGTGSGAHGPFLQVGAAFTLF